MCRLKIMRKIFALSLACSLSISSLAVLADDNTLETSVSNQVLSNERVATNGGIATLGSSNASITINGNGFSQSLVGKKFHVYKLLNAENAVGMESINYTLNPTYAPALQAIVGTKLNKPANQVTEYEIVDYIQSLNHFKVEGANTPQQAEGATSAFRYFIEELRNKINELGIMPSQVDVTSVKADNSIEIRGLDFGYYIIDEVTNVSNTHSAGSLCMVNTANPNASINIKSDYPSVTKKIQEDDNRGAIGSDGWNDIGDFEIGQTVPYKFTSNIPNMNGYDTYYYAWRDKMSNALTFNRNSVSIVIKDANKSYTLLQNEFVVTENPSHDEAFMVEINDIKAIVDREFNNRGLNGDNVYDQEVILTYNATLNDNAANNTGRPGFENEVKLVFSNDPDGNGQGVRGETPWDTVVCFTYALLGVKVNDHGAVLENARFRLYSDKDCTNEVFVKKTPNGYNVINRDILGGNNTTGGTTPADAVEMVSDSKGIFNIYGLDGGTYYLKEVGAPPGYRQLLDPIEITVTPDITVDRNSYVKGQGSSNAILKGISGTALVRTFWSGVFTDDTLQLKSDVDNGTVALSVVNKVGSKLPVTGSSATIVLITLGSGLMGYSVVRSRKEK